MEGRSGFQGDPGRRASMGSDAPIAGAGAGPGRDGGSQQHGFDDDRSDAGSAVSEREMNMAGMPIGFLAARGTPYEKKPLYKSKKCLFICIFFVPFVVAIAVVIAVLPVLHAVAQHTLNVSVLQIYSSNITTPTNNNFTLTLDGQAKKVGIFPAHVFFHQPVNVYWINPDNQEELQLGTFPLARIGIAAGHGRIRQETFFEITNEEGFGRFTEFLITQKEFTWRLKSYDVQAKAFSFLATNGLTFEKDLTLPAIANFSDISIEDFQLPGDDPQGGISSAVVTRINNPSAFGVSLGTLLLDLYYQGVYLGPIQSVGFTNLTTGINQLNLAGHLLDYSNNATALAILSDLFTRYLAGDVSDVVGIGRSATLPDGTELSWLNRGIRALTLHIPLVSPQGPINPIKSISIGSFNLAFDPNNPYAPIASSNNVLGGIALPFGFSLNISNVANDISIIQNGTYIANLTAPEGSASVRIDSRTAAYTTGSLTLQLPPAPLQVGSSYTDHLAYSQFQTDFTILNQSTFFLRGYTNATTDTPLGQVTLTRIPFNVPAGLLGLQGLTSSPTIINSVDVLGGTPDYLQLNISVTLTNPSNLDLTVGDVTFQLFNGDTFIGRTIIPNLRLAIGTNTIYSLGQFEANSNAIARDTLTRFVAQQPTVLGISGFNGSTNVESLQQPFMAIQLNSTLNGLPTKIVQSANLTVLPTTGVTDNAATTVVNINNPFTAPITITNIQSNVTSRGIYLGQIGTELNFVAAGRAVSQTPALTFQLNLYPPSVFSLLRQLASEAGLSTEQIDGIVQLGGYEYQPTTGPPNSTIAKRSLFGDRKGLAPRDGLHRRVTNIYTGFNLPTYVLTAFRQLTVQVELAAQTSIGDFFTTLQYTQSNVPTYVDNTLLLLLPVLARPIVQKIVDGSILTIDTATILNPQQTSFGTAITGAIRNAGPFDAVISFPQGLTVTWNARTLGQLAMPNITLEAEVGATLDMTSQFAVADVGYLTEFTIYLLNQPSFVWQISAENITVSALGISVDSVSISKEVILAGINAFRNNGVVINDFDLPANDPAGGITLTIQTTITNPSSIGVELSTFSVLNTYGSTNIGPAAATAPFTLQPKSTFQLPLRGRLVSQVGNPTGLSDVETLFNGYIHGVPGQLVVNGDQAGPAGVTWLNDGIKTLHIPVILPAAQNLQIINSITINQLTLLFTVATAWDPSFSTNNTVAAFQLPFAFPLDITRIQNNITTADNGVDFAQLIVPDSPAATDVVARIIRLMFSDVPFDVFDNRHPTFSQFLTDTTVGTTKTFTLKGSANTLASTAVGDLNIRDIGFNVDTTILGLQGLNARPAFVTDLDVFRGYVDYLQINVNAHLYNPSNITIGTGDVAFGLYFNDALIGTANIQDLLLVPGENVIPTQVRYSPQGSAVAQGQLLLENFIQSVPSTTIIAGNENTTPIASLVQALSAIRLSTVIPPLMQNLVTGTQLVLPRNIVQTGIAQARFNLSNPFTASINLARIIANASYEGINLGQIREESLDPRISAPGHTQITSPFLAFNFNLNPRDLIAFILALGRNTGTDLGPLPDLFETVLGLDNLDTTITTMPADGPSSCNSGNQFPVNQQILRALQGLRTNLSIQSTVFLDLYRTDLNFNQYNVPTQTGPDALYLIGAVGSPIVQYLVDRSTLFFTQGNITQVTDRGFQVDLVGSLLGTGPFDALIQFPEPVTVTWQGRNIARIELPDICAAANVGVPNYRPTAQLTITDLSEFTRFATFILHNPSFTWTISSPRVTVTALDTVFENVILTKDITFSAFNNLPGVTIFNFDLPGDAAEGGINIRTGSLIPSPSNLGIELGDVTFNTYFMGNLVGPISANDLFLLPNGTTSTILTGRIVPQDKDGLRTLGILFSQFLLGENSTLEVVGQSVVSPAQPNKPVNWLTTAFRTLTLQVTLPGVVYQVIYSITLEDLTVTIENQDQAYRPLTSNNRTDAVYANPFTFSLTARRTAPDLILRYPTGGPNTARLTLPDAPVDSAETSTGNRAALTLSWENEPLVSLNNGQFNSLFAGIALQPSASFDLVGNTSVLARTAVGDVPITALPVNVTSSLRGLNNLGGTAEVVGVPAVIGSGSLGDLYGTSFGPDYIRLSLDIVLNNPSNITINTNQVSFGLYYRGVFVGRNVIENLNLIPGRNEIRAQAHYAPANAADPVATDLISQYLQVGSQIPVSVQGDQMSSPYGSLKDAFDGINLSTSITGANVRLVTQVTIFLDLGAAICSGTTSITFSALNTLDTPFVLNKLQNNASQGGVTYAQFTHQFTTPFELPVNEEVTSERIYSVRLPLGAIRSLPLFVGFLEGLTLTNFIDNDIQAEGGYNIPNLAYTQSGVPYNFVFVSEAGQPISDPIAGGDGAGAAAQVLQRSTCTGGIFVPPNEDIPGLPSQVQDMLRAMRASAPSSALNSTVSAAPTSSSAVSTSTGAPTSAESASASPPPPTSSDSQTQTAPASKRDNDGQVLDAVRRHLDAQARL